jgi:predicted NBD/HSP70 family sugar kinase
MSTRSYLNQNLASDNEGRQGKQSERIIRYLSKSSAAVTIPNLASHIKISIPTITKLLNELIKKRLVVAEGKKKTVNGRQPALYSLAKDRFYAVGAEVLLKRVQVTIINLNYKSEFSVSDKTFILENTYECCDRVIEFIDSAIEQSGVQRGHILGVGVGLTGRVNSQTGRSFNFFNFGDRPVADYLASKLGFPVCIDNDTRAIGLAEQVIGAHRQSGNTLILNIGRGIGMSMISNRKIIVGASGFAGELGHMQFAGNRGRLCICGKKGCLDTEVSGKALETDLAEAIAAGDLSSVFNDENISGVRYDDIIEAANNGDQLSLSLLQAQGEKLGTALGNIINLLNPEIIVVSGKYSRVGEFFLDSVRYGLHRTALKDTLSGCVLTSSQVASQAGAIGAASLVFRRYELV